MKLGSLLYSISITLYAAYHVLTGKSTFSTLLALFVIDILVLVSFYGLSLLIFHRKNVAHFLKSQVKGFKKLLFAKTTEESEQIKREYDLRINFLSLLLRGSSMLLALPALISILHNISPFNVTFLIVSGVLLFSSSLANFIYEHFIQPKEINFEQDVKRIKSELLHAILPVMICIGFIASQLKAAEEARNVFIGNEAMLIIATCILVLVKVAIDIDRYQKSDKSQK